MERKFYTDDFEQLLKERSDEFRMYPSKRVWHSIYNDLHPGRKWPSVAVSLILIIALFLAGYWNSNDTNSSIATIAVPGGSTQNDPKNITVSSNNNAIQQQFATAIDNYNFPAATASTNTKNLNTGSSPETRIVNPKINGLSKSQLPSIVIKNTYPENFNKENSNADAGYSKYQQQKFNGILQNLLTKQTSIKTSESVNKDNLTSDDIIKETAAFDIFNTIKNTETNTVTIKNVNAAVENMAGSKKEDNLSTTVTNSVAAKNNTLSAQDRAWIEDYALHNKSQRGRWKDRVAIEFYATPSIGYRKLASNSVMAANMVNYIAQSVSPSGITNSLNHKPGLGLETGLGLVYAAAKNLRLKAGIQATITNYIINADETNHPILTTLLLNELNTGYPYMVSRISTVANTSGLQPVKLHNKTYQVSIPVGLAIKLSGNSKFEWYAGASAQPTYVIGGKANLISADKRNYVSDHTFIRHWSLNAGLETYVQYKLSGYTLQFGPQLRYQLVSTYSKQLSLNENLYNMGLKIGILKNF